MTLVTPYFHHERVIGDGNGIFGDKSDLSQKFFSLVVFTTPSLLRIRQCTVGPNLRHPVAYARSP
jgi:hypothetical protein